MGGSKQEDITSSWHDLVEKARLLDEEDASFQLLPGEMNQVTLFNEPITVPIAVTTTWLPAITSGNPLEMQSYADELRQVESALRDHQYLIDELEDRLDEWEGDAAKHFNTYRISVLRAMLVYQEGAGELARCLEGYSALIDAARADALGLITDAMAALDQYEEDSQSAGLYRVLNVFQATFTALDGARSANFLVLADALASFTQEIVNCFIGGDEIQKVVDSCADGLEKVYEKLVADAPVFTKSFQQVAESIVEHTPSDVARGALPTGEFDPNEFGLYQCPEFAAILASGTIDTSAITPPPEGETEDHD